MNESLRLHYVEEPRAVFAHGQKTEHPKDGLFFFGPFDRSAAPGCIRIGVIGPPDCLARFDRWSKQVRSAIATDQTRAHRSNWPGFSGAFAVDWPEKPLVTISIGAQALSDAIHRENRHEAVYEAVGLFESAIRSHIEDQDDQPDIWFVVIPEAVYKLCRPESTVIKSERTESTATVTKREAKKAHRGGSLFLFPADQRSAELYEYEVNFHNQLKARLLDTPAVIQIVRETTIAPSDFVNAKGQPLRRVDDPATIAWNLCTTAFFKCQGKPWKLDGVRPGVCYVGLVFKRLETPTREGNACCGAQMFLDSGDGVVFKGAIGQWYSEETRECHLSREKAAQIADLIVSHYKKEHGAPPKELFIHGRTRFNEDELAGFRSAVPPETVLTGVRIQRNREFKLFRAQGDTPVIRGTSFVISKRRAFLWTSGYVPRLKTYPGWEVPSPLEIDITPSEVPIETVVSDVLALTKLNYNACIYGDGVPVTLRFADAVGEILTAAPLKEGLGPLPFRRYI